MRGLPALVLYTRDTNRLERISLALFSATGLPLIVVITTIGTSEGKMRPENAAALVGCRCGVRVALPRDRTAAAAKI